MENRENVIIDYAELNFKLMTGLIGKDRLFRMSVTKTLPGSSSIDIQVTVFVKIYN